MKKLIALLLALVMVLALAACAAKTEPAKTETTTDELDASKKAAQQAEKPTKDAIANAFVDIKGDAK